MTYELWSVCQFFPTVLTVSSTVLAQIVFAMAKTQP